MEIWDVLSECGRPPSTTEDWKKIAEEFLEFWDMPYCIGTLDGKQISRRKPSNLVPCSIIIKVCLAWYCWPCATRYCFTVVDVGEYGSNIDSVILRNSKLGRKFGNGEMNIPES